MLVMPRDTTSFTSNSPRSNAPGESARGGSGASTACGALAGTLSDAGVEVGAEGVISLNGVADVGGVEADAVADVATGTIGVTAGSNGIEETEVEGVVETAGATGVEATGIADVGVAGFGVADGWLLGAKTSGVGSVFMRIEYSIVEKEGVYAISARPDE